MGRAISNRCSMIMAADPDHLTQIEQVGMGASSEAEGLVLQKDSWVAAVGEHSRW